MLHIGAHLEHEAAVPPQATRHNVKAENIANRRRLKVDRVKIQAIQTHIPSEATQHYGEHLGAVYGIAVFLRQAPKILSIPNRHLQEETKLLRARDCRNR